MSFYLVIMYCHCCTLLSIMGPFGCALQSMFMALARKVATMLINMQWLWCGSSAGILLQVQLFLLSICCMLLDVQTLTTNQELLVRHHTQITDQREYSNFSSISLILSKWNDDFCYDYHLFSHLSKSNCSSVSLLSFRYWLSSHPSFFRADLQSL